MKTTRLMRLCGCHSISTQILCEVIIIGHLRGKTCLLGLGTIKAQTSLRTTQTNQRLCYSLFESIISLLATSETPMLFFIKCLQLKRLAWVWLCRKPRRQVFLQAHKNSIQQNDNCFIGYEWWVNSSQVSAPTKILLSMTCFNLDLCR